MRCIGKTTPAGAKITNDEEFATALLEEKGVAVVFGAAFGLYPKYPFLLFLVKLRLEELQKHLTKRLVSLPNGWSPRTH